MADEIVTNQQKSSLPYIGAGAVLGGSAGYAAINIAKDKNPISKWVAPKYKTIDDIVKELNAKDTFTPSEKTGITQELMDKYKASLNREPLPDEKKSEVTEAMKREIENYKQKIKGKDANSEEVKKAKEELTRSLEEIRKSKDSKFSMEKLVAEYKAKRAEIIENAKKEGKDIKSPEVKDAIKKEADSLHEKIANLRVIKPEVKEGEKAKIGIDKAIKDYKENLEKYRNALANGTKKDNPSLGNAIKELKNKNLGEFKNACDKVLEQSKRASNWKTASIIGGAAVVFAALGGLISKNRE